MYIVGIDIGKRHHEASIIDEKGNLQGKSLRFANSHTGFNKLLETVRKSADDADIVFGRRPPIVLLVFCWLLIRLRC